MLNVRRRRRFSWVFAGRVSRWHPENVVRRIHVAASAAELSECSEGAR